MEDEKEKYALTTPDAAETDDNTSSASGCRGCLWALAGVGGCAFIAAVAVVAALALGLTSVGALIGGIGGIFGLGPVTPRADVVSTRTLVSAIQPLGQLVSVSTDLRVDDIRVGVQQGLGNSCGVSASHTAQGAVEAGIDLTRITEEDIEYDALRNTYVVTVPAPELTSCRLDVLQQHSYSTTLCATDWDELNQLARYTALTQFRDDALEGGILERAEIEARLVLMNFLQIVTNGSIELIFEEPEAAALPASCQPAPPEDWSFNAQTGSWMK